MRLMSYAITTEQMRKRTKLETRRLGWKNAKPGQRIVAVEKCMGLRKGERVKPLGVIEVEEVWREPLGAITKAGCIREGFPELSPTEFVEMFRRSAHAVTADTEVTVIRFRHIPDEILDEKDFAQWHRLNS